MVCLFDVYMVGAWMNPFFICMFVSSINWNDIQNML